MTRTRSTFDVTIKVTSPVMCQGLDSSGLGVDASFVRDQLGRPILPADHIKGLLAAALRHRFGDTADDLLGRKSGKADAAQNDEPELLGEDTNAPHRGHLYLTDFAFDPPAGQTATFTHRVAIDAETGAAKDGALQEIELIAPLGDEIDFNGQITTYAGDPNQELARLKTALDAIPTVGGFKSAGFGEVVAVSIKAGAKPKAASVLDTKAARLDVDITFDRPLLVDAARLADNLFQSSAIIPGAVIKGALAQALTRAGTLTKWSDDLSEIGISHAFPLSQTGDKILMWVPPQSLTLDAEANEVVDALLAGADAGVLVGDQPGLFANDWKPKQWAAAVEAMGWDGTPVSASIQRTRVAIGEDGVAEDRLLFAHQLVPSVWDGDAAKPRMWRLTLSRHGASQEGWAAVLAQLALGLDGVGKSDARLTMAEPVPSNAPGLPEPLELGGDKVWAVTLVTPALMLDPDADWDAKAQYAAYWTWALKELGATGPVDLLDWFSDEKLHGGYEAMRRGLFGTGRYQPLVITQPGSVFLIKDAPGVEDALGKALAEGLPPRPPAASKKESLTWEDTTFVPENGYGQIALNHEAHQRLRPGGADV